MCASTNYGYELAGHFGGTRPTAADFEFLMGATGAGIVASGLWGLRSLHGGGGVSACFDFVVRDVAGSEEERLNQEVLCRFKKMSIDGSRQRLMG